MVSQRPQQSPRPASPDLGVLELINHPLIVFLLLGLWLSACAGPTEPIRDDESLTSDSERYTRLSELPRQFRGTFQWDDIRGVQQVEVFFESARVDDDGQTWIIDGRGKYTASQVTNIDIRARINSRTGEFQMWESNPDGDDFVTSGSHVGRINGELERIEARWKGDDGREGTLVLRAADDEEDET